MDNKKFCFISCVNNKQYYDECLYYISKLNIPEGYDIEILSITDAKSITSGYNEAMKASDAKYKIYLHQDTFILDENFLYIILHTFKDKSIGLIGAAGSKTIGIDGVWWLSEYCYGDYYDNCNIKMSRDKHNKQILGKYEEQSVVDGMLMITQYDIPWREDIFDGWHFYDSSQCTEFRKNGYKVVIPNVNKPWIMHDCNTVNDDKQGDYKKYLDRFREEYYYFLFPLVSILIPVNGDPNDLLKSLDSAVAQKYKNIEIIIYDVTNNNNCEQAVKEYLLKYDNIKYIHNYEEADNAQVIGKLLELSKGRYVNILMPGDVFNKYKIMAMMEEFLQDANEELSLVSSDFYYYDESNKYYENINDERLKEAIFNKRYSGRDLIKIQLSIVNNVIGELSNVLFDKSKLTDDIGVYENDVYKNNIDRALWFNLLKSGGGIILNKCYSDNKLNKDKYSEENMLIDTEEYITALISSSENNIIDDINTYYKLLDSEKYNILTLLHENTNNIELQGYLSVIDSEINKIKNHYEKINVVVPIYNADTFNDIKEQIDKQTYINYDVTYLIFDKEKGVNSNENIIYSDVLITEYENFDRVIKSFDSKYFLVIDADQELEDNAIEKMFQEIKKDNIGAVVYNVENSLKENTTYNFKDGALYIAEHYNDFLLSNYSVLIDRSYYNNCFFNYDNSRYINLGYMATLCSILKYGNITIIKNKNKEIKLKNIKDTEILIKYIQLLNFLNMIRKDGAFSVVVEYRVIFNDVEETINALVERLNISSNEKMMNMIEEVIKDNKVTNEFAFKNLGPNNTIGKGMELYCPQRIEIGNFNIFGKDATLMVPNNKDDERFNGHIKIGNGCDLGRRLFVSSVNKVTIEDNVIIASNVHIADHNHEYHMVGIPIMLQGVSSTTNEVVIGQGTWIGQGCVIVGDVKIGRGCVIGANSVVTHDIPDYCVAVGQPARVVKYFDRNTGDWTKVTEDGQLEAYKKSEKNMQPIFTIGIPTYNRSSYLDRCLDSIYKQIGNDKMIEVLVVNNASTDATSRVVEKYKSKYDNLTYIEREETINGDENISSIYKLGKGEFINSHGDDDFYNPTIIYKIVNAIYMKRDISFVFSLPSSKKEVYYGKGIDDYIQHVSYVGTLITGLIISKKIIDKVYDKKINKFCFNQVLFQLESLLINDEFAVIQDAILSADSGEHMPAGYNFGEFFINNYLGLLEKYIGNGLSINVYVKEKENLLNKMIIPWILKIKKENLQLKLDGFSEYYDKYYKNETYYSEKKEIIDKILGL